MVTLTGASTVSGDVFQTCAATTSLYCLKSGVATSLAVSQDAGLVFFIRDDAAASSSFKLTVAPVP
jgi:hypothetical protein